MTSPNVQRLVNAQRYPTNRNPVLTKMHWVAMGYEPRRNKTSVLNRYRRVDDASCYPCHAASWSLLLAGFRVDSRERLNRSRSFSRCRNWLARLYLGHQISMYLS